MRRAQVATWIVVLACGAGFVWLWAHTGDGDMTAKIVVVVLMGIMWSAVVLGVAGLVVGALGVGSLMFRRPRR